MFGPITSTMFDASERKILLGCKTVLQSFPKAITEKRQEEITKSHICAKSSEKPKPQPTMKSLCMLSKIGCLPASIANGPLSISNMKNSIIHQASWVVRSYVEVSFGLTESGIRFWVQNPRNGVQNKVKDLCKSINYIASILHADASPLSKI